MSSTRLPGKVLMKLGTKPVILQILDRFASILVNCTFLSTSTNSKDHLIASLAESHGYKVFRNDEDDLAKRFLEIIKEELDYFVRVTGDDLFRNIRSIIPMYKKMLKEGLDYIFADDLILGCNSEIISKDAIKFIYNFAKFREHTNDLTFYLDRPSVFKFIEYKHQLKNQDYLYH